MGAHNVPLLPCCDNRVREEEERGEKGRKEQRWLCLHYRSGKYTLEVILRLRERKTRRRQKKKKKKKKKKMLGGDLRKVFFNSIYKEKLGNFLLLA